MDDSEPIDHEKDLRCQLAFSKKKGREEGRVEKMTDFVIALSKGGFSDSEIAGYVAVTVAEVRQIRDELCI